MQPGQLVCFAMPEYGAGPRWLFAGQTSIQMSVFNVHADDDVAKGAEIFDNALCGGGDPNQGIYSTCSIANYNIKAAIFMGDPRFKAGAPYNVGK